MSNPSNNQNNQDAKYFDLHTVGIGYLNRERTVNPDKGDSYVSVSIAALHGRSDSPSYSYFDTRVVGGDALEFIKAHKEAINDRNSKVLVRFKVGDGEATSYEVKSGDNKGNRNHIIKSRLLQITWASINGEVVLNMAGHESGNEFPDNAERSSAPASTGNDTPADTPAQPAASQDAGLAEVVKLDRNDPDFVTRRAQLKESGYKWDSSEMVWRLQLAA